MQFLLPLNFSIVINIILNAVIILGIYVVEKNINNYLICYISRFITKEKRFKILNKIFTFHVC